jgi:hypothetical protein
MNCELQTVSIHFSFSGIADSKLFLPTSPLQEFQIPNCFCHLLLFMNCGFQTVSVNFASSGIPSYLDFLGLWTNTRFQDASANLASGAEEASKLCRLTSRLEQYQVLNCFCSVCVWRAGNGKTAKMRMVRTVQLFE